MTDREESLYLNGLFPILPGHFKLDTLTRSSLEFTAPELRSGGAATQAADVFALGAYLYHFLGNHEFPAHLNEQQLYQHLRVQLPIICGAGTRFSWIEPILDKMLQWKPSNRYQNAMEVFKEVEDKCPEMGVFGAGTLKSIDNAAASYIMSPFTRVAVAIFTLVALVFNAHEQYNSSNTLASTGSTNLANVQELNLSSSVFSRYATNSSEPIKSSSASQEINRYDDYHLINANYQRNQRKRHDNEHLSWARRSDSALVHILRYGSLTHNPDEPLCHQRHIGRRFEN